MMSNHARDPREGSIAWILLLLLIEFIVIAIILGYLI